MRDVDERDGDGDEVLPLFADHLALLHILAQVGFDLPADDLFEAAVILVNFQRHLLFTRFLQFLSALRLTPSRRLERRCWPRSSRRPWSRFRSTRSSSSSGPSPRRSSPASL